MQTMKLTLELPYDPQVASMLLAASSAALQVEAEQAPKPAEQQAEEAADPELEEPRRETPPEATTEPEPQTPRKAPKRAAPAKKAPEPAKAAASLEEVATAPETAPETAPAAATKTEAEAPQAPATPATGVSMNDLRKEAVRLAQNQKQAELRAVLEKYGASAVSKIPAERYDEALADLRAVETEPKAEGLV